MPNSGNVRSAHGVRQPDVDVRETGQPISVPGESGNSLPGDRRGQEHRPATLETRRYELDIGLRVITAMIMQVLGEMHGHRSVRRQFRRLALLRPVAAIACRVDEHSVAPRGPFGPRAEARRA